MKSLTAWILAGTLMVLAVPMAAQAHEWGAPWGAYGWRYRDRAHDRHDIHRDWRDVSRDRFEVRQDLATGRWGAARAEQADIYHDLNDIRRDRWDLHRDYNGVRDPNFGYMPMSYGNYPVRSYRAVPVVNYNIPTVPVQNYGLLP